MKEKSILNKSDIQVTIQEINILKEKLKRLKEEKINEENVGLLQQLDKELTDKLFKISSCPK